MNQVSTTTLGRILKDTYRIDHYLGEGGPSIVYKGTDVLLDVPVAIKRLKSGLPLSSGSSTAQRFLREARTQARLHHQNIVGIRAMLEEGEDTFIVMEFVEGVDLHEYIGLFPKYRLPLNEIFPIFGQALAGLGFAHKHGVIHRDIKPSNILMGGGLVVKLADFGIARAVDDQKLTQTGSLLGTLLYISPEQLRGEPADNRSDVYSMGISLYEAVVGHTPFARNPDDVHNGYELLSRHLFTQPEPPIALRTEIPQALNDVILQSIAKVPEQRFQDCQSFAEALQESLHGITQTKRWSHPLERATSVTMAKVHTPDAPLAAPFVDPLTDPLAASPKQMGTQTVHPPDVEDPLASSPPKGTQTIHPPEPAPAQETPPPKTAHFSRPSNAPDPILDPLGGPVPSGDDFAQLPPPPKRGTKTLPPHSLQANPLLDLDNAAKHDSPSPASTSSYEDIPPHLLPTGHASDFSVALEGSPLPAQTITDDQLSVEDLKSIFTPPPTAPSLPPISERPVHTTPSERIAQASALSTQEMQRISNTLRDDNGPSPLSKNKKPRSSAPFVLILLVLLVAGGGGWYYFSMQPTQPSSLQGMNNNPVERKALVHRTSPTPTRLPANQGAQQPVAPTKRPPQVLPKARVVYPTPSPTRREPPKQEAPVGMLWIPSGWFWQGREKTRAYKKSLHHPLRKVFVSGFWLDQYEVTVGAYKQCVQAGHCKEVSVRFDEKGRSKRKKQAITVTFSPKGPMRFVQWQEARNYCRWQRKRLPTEAEWEYAARGDADQGGPKRMFPWEGKELSCLRAIHKGCARRPLPASSNRLFGRSPFQIMDMSGNVWEWVQDCYDPNSANFTPPTNPIYDLPNCKRRILRGGSFRSKQPYELSVFHRRHSPITTRRDENGFRCASSPRR